MGKKKWIWMFLCLIIAGLTIWAVVSQTQSFDWNVFCQDLLAADKGWLIAALVSMCGFIVFEGLAVRSILKTIAPQWINERHCVLYAAADVYFSAITPSASGGQPVMAYFMRKDKLSMAEITSSLLLNLIIYTVALFLLALCGSLIHPSFILGYSAFGKTLITIGFVILVALIFLFWILLFNETLMGKIIDGVFRFLQKFIHFKNFESKRARLKNMVEEYKDCAQIIHGKPKMLVKVLGWNILQRLGQTLVSVCLFFATGGPLSKAFDVWLAQIFSAVGSNCVPIPGGMGAADYLLIDGFSQVPAIESAANMALLSRGVYFYSCVILSAIIVLYGYLTGRKK